MRYEAARAGLWLVAGAIAFGPSCGGIQRKPRTVLGGSAAYAHSEDVGFSYDDEPPIQRQHQLGGIAELTRVSGEENYQTGRAVVLAGTLERSENFIVDDSRDPYWIVGLGGAAGWDYTYVGHEFGLNLVLVPQGVQLDSWITGVPYYRLRIGPHDSFAAELQAGSQRGLLFETRMFSGGMRMVQGRSELHIGAAVGGRLMVSQERKSSVLLLGTRESLDAMFYTQGVIELSPRWSLRFDVEIGQQLPSLSLGVGYDL